MITKITCSK